jgi:hypothetical protein
MNPVDKQKIITKVLAALTEEEKHQLLQWAQGARRIQSDTSLSLTQRFGQLQRLEMKPFVASVLRRLFQELKVKAWHDRSWPVRLGVGGLAFGGQSIGVAGFGSAVGVSLALVSGVGGTFLGLLISHLEAEKKKKIETSKKSSQNEGRS